MPGPALQPVGNDLQLPFQSPEVGTRRGYGGSYRTTDGGVTWTPQP